MYVVVFFCSRNYSCKLQTYANNNFWQTEILFTKFSKIHSIILVYIIEVSLMSVHYEHKKKTTAAMML